MHAQLTDLLVPKQQLGVGMKGGLEAAIHCGRKALKHLQDQGDMCILKLDFSKAFIECSRGHFLDVVERCLPKIFAWKQYCYRTEAELRFGDSRILSSTGVQQGDPLGPLLLSLVLSQMLEEVEKPKDASLQLSYLDDGTVIAPRHSVAAFLNQVALHGPKYGLLFNPKKCEVYWPSGDDTFPEFPSDVNRLTKGVTLLGSPLWGTTTFMTETVAGIMERVFAVQSKLPGLEDKQVAVHMLRSCLGVCVR